MYLSDQIKGKILSNALEYCVIRILNTNGITVGTGFLIAKNLVVTCAHVVRIAGSKPGNNIAVEFYNVGQQQTCWVSENGFAEPQRDNIAFLQLDTQPDNVSPCVLGTSHDLLGHNYISLGFPYTQHSNLYWARGKIVDLVSMANRADLLVLEGKQVEKGMSGAPVFDLDTGQVIGMLTESYEENHPETAYAIKSETLIAYWLQTLKTNPKPIHMGGGSMEIRGNVNTLGGDFIGRDQIDYSKHITRINYGDVNFYSEPPNVESFLPPPQQISKPTDDFVGRKNELDILYKSVIKEEATVIGIMGLGGVGKTALAYKLADILKENYGDGQLMFDLHGADIPIPPEIVLDRFIHSFHPVMTIPADLESLKGLYRQILSGKKIIILLDNVHDVEQISPLLPPPDGCLVIVTSRMHFYFPGMKNINLNILPEVDAIKLLQEIESRIGDYATGLARACGHLPLALTVIGALLHTAHSFEPTDALTFMKEEAPRLELTGVEISLETSYRMIPESLQQKWQKLAVFSGDFGIDAAMWIWEIVTEDAEDTLIKRKRIETKRALERLQTYSLVEYKKDRYRLHDLARIFLKKKLITEDNFCLTKVIHTQYYFSYLAMCTQEFNKGGTHIIKAVEMFDREFGEILEAQAWCAANTDFGENLLLCELFPYVGVFLLYLRLHPSKHIQWLKDGLQAAKQLDDKQMKANHLGNLGIAYRELGDMSQAIACFKPWLLLTQEIGDRGGEGSALGHLGALYFMLGDVKLAINYFEQQLLIDREVSNRRGEGHALGGLGQAYAALGDIEKAFENFHQWLDVTQEIGDRIGEANALGGLGNVYYSAEKFYQAIEFFEKQLLIISEIGDQRGEAFAWGNLGNAYSDLGSPQNAIECYTKCLEICNEIGNLQGESDTLSNLGIIHIHLNDYQQAITFFERALDIDRSTGNRYGEAVTCWNLGLLHEMMGNIEQAVEFLQFNVNYLLEINRHDAKAHSIYLTNIRSRIK